MKYEDITKKFIVGAKHFYLTIKILITKKNASPLRELFKIASSSSVRLIPRNDKWSVILSLRARQQASEAICSFPYVL